MYFNVIVIIILIFSQQIYKLRMKHNYKFKNLVYHKNTFFSNFLVQKNSETKGSPIF